MPQTYPFTKNPHEIQANLLITIKNQHDFVDSGLFCLIHALLFSFEHCSSPVVLNPTGTQEILSFTLSDFLEWVFGVHFGR